MTGGPTRSVSVCLPALNEGPNLEAVVADVIAAVAPLCDWTEVVIADDGSSDDTPRVLERLRAAPVTIRVVKHARTRGYGAACRSALLAARGDLLLLADADGQFDFRDFGPLVEALSGVDAVIGYRSDRQDGWRRVATGRLWTRLVNLALGYTARDVNCAFKLVRRAWAQPLLATVTSDGAAFSAEWMARARRAGVRIREVPVRHRPRARGQPTGGRLTVMLRGLVELNRVRQALRAPRGAPGRRPSL